jgi:hypothetical protein
VKLTARRAVHSASICNVVRVFSTDILKSLHRMLSPFFAVKTNTNTKKGRMEE